MIDPLSLHDLAKPFLEECERRGVEAMVFLAESRNEGHLIHAGRERGFFNHPGTLLHIAQAPQTSFEILATALFGTAEVVAANGDRPLAGSLATKGEPPAP